MILIGFTASIFIIILKKIFNISHLSRKFFILGLFTPSIGYCLNTYLSICSVENFNLLIFNSLFLITFFLILIYIYSEYKKNLQYKIIGRAFFLGFLIHSFLGYLFWPEPLNLFWPINDYDLKFSLFNNLFLKNNPNSNTIYSIYFIIEFSSLFFYGKLLMHKLVKKSGTAEDISRIGKLLKIQKYLFLILLFIFFVIYAMQILSIDIFLMIFLIFYSPLLMMIMYANYKTDFKLI